MKLIRIMMACLVAGSIPACKCTTASKSGEQGYLIPSDRPEKIGNQYHLEGHAASKADSFAMADGNTYHEKSETGTIDLVGTLTVAAVASNGHASAFDIVVGTCEMIRNGTPSSIIKDGDQLSVAKTAAASNGTVRLNGIELDPWTAFLITSFLPLSEPDKTELAGPFYGIDVRRKVGERWTMNPVAFAKFMEAWSPGATESDFKGTGEFMAITRTNGGEWAELRFDMTSLAPPPVQDPWRTTGYRANTKMEISTPLGVKPARQNVKISRTQKVWMESDYTGHGVLQHLQFNTSSKHDATCTVTPLDAD
jgi:hypothetical protein